MVEKCGWRPCDIDCFIDLRKAFDNVSIPILIKQLPMIGITGLELELFK